MEGIVVDIRIPNNVFPGQPDFLEFDTIENARLFFDSLPVDINGDKYQSVIVELFDSKYVDFDVFRNIWENGNIKGLTSSVMPTDF